jgi:hypothetical protein
VRVLVNVRPDSYWMDTIFHKLGHAVYDKHINPALPYSLRTIVHTCTTEAVTLMMDSLVDDPAWLSAVAALPPKGGAMRKETPLQQFLTEHEESFAPLPKESPTRCAS